MNIHDGELRLTIDSPLASASSPNFRPSTWPLPDDFPIIIDANGTVVSRYADVRWNLWPWAGQMITLNFGDGPQRQGTALISAANARLFRQVVAWWIYGPRGVRNAKTLRSRFETFRSLFIVCSRDGVVASKLSENPDVIDRLAKLIAPSKANPLLQHLHALNEQRQQLGFSLLDRQGLVRLAANPPNHQRRQTAYIPPRIWLYQITRLREFLDDFHRHREGIEACYHFCLDAYAANSGSIANAWRITRGRGQLPFGLQSGRTGVRSGLKFHGAFSETARRFGIAELLHRWLLTPDQTIDIGGRGLLLFGSYLTMVGRVGTAYLLNFSLMRIEECTSLRSDCLSVERDEQTGERIFLLKGATTKTVEDEDARWIASPSASVAVEAMTSVARLRSFAAQSNPQVKTSAQDIARPYLLLRGYEPWMNNKHLSASLAMRPQSRKYSELVADYPNLLALEALKITVVDLQRARLVTPTLDEKTFAIGKVWPLAWHQLRRTGAVNMQASGLVSDASVQYQLKHATRAMSRYYGQGYSHIALNDEARAVYIRAMYEVLGKEIGKLLSDRFVSPHGEQHKADILKIVASQDSDHLTKAAKVGKVSWRETLLGGCTKIGPCEYGGVDTIARCSGGDGHAACVHALFDRERRPQIRQLGQVIEARLVDAPAASPYRESLEAQQRAVENALNVIDR